MIPLIIMAAGMLYKGISQANDAKMAGAMAEQDAQDARLQATIQAQRILRHTASVRGAARAATAASGARIDQFSLANEQDIQAAGETDAAMTILGGESQAKMSELRGSMYKQQAENAMTNTLFSIAGEGAKRWSGTIGTGSGGGDPRAGVRGQRGYD